MFQPLTPLWLLNIGSVFLGMTLAIIMLWIFCSRHSSFDVAEACLISVLSIFGFGVSVLFYASATLI